MTDKKQLRDTLKQRKYLVKDMKTGQTTLISGPPPGPK
jgi:hypothetical protein